MINILKQDENDAYGIRHYLADEEKDLKEIGASRLSPGSTVFVIATSQTYMLNGSKAWVKIAVSSGGGSGGGGTGPSGPTYDGGSIPVAPPKYDGGTVKRRR